MLNGKYATSRSAGNYLAGKNAAVGTLGGVNISFDAFQNLAGALHQGEREEEGDRRPHDSNGMPGGAAQGVVRCR